MPMPKYYAFRCRYELFLHIEQINDEQHLQNPRTENVINMLGDAALALMNNACTRMLYAVIGTGVALILLYILFMYLHVSEHHHRFVLISCLWRYANCKTLKICEQLKQHNK